MFLPKKISRFFTLSISGAAAFTLAGCGSGGGLADSATASRIVPVSNGEVDVSLSQVNGGSVSSSRVGLVAFATGVDKDRGQIVAVAGIADGATVGEPVTEGTVTYDTTYNYNVSGDISRSRSTISSRTISRSFDGRTTLTADFDTGRLTGGRTFDLEVDGRINGQTVSGTAVVNFDTSSSFSISPPLIGTVSTDLNGQIGDTGVIATFDGSDEDTAVAGGLVGTAN